MSYNHDGTAASRLAVSHDTQLNFGGTVPFTISAWVTLPSGYNQITWAALLAKFDNTWRISVVSGNDYGWHFVTGGSNWDVAENNNDDILHHFLFVKVDGSTRNRYVDGQLTGTTGSGSLGTNTAELWIGNNSQQTSRGLQGKFEDMRLYDRALSAKEAQILYNARGHDGIVDGLVAHWRFLEDAPGKTIVTSKDFANGNGHDASNTSPVVGTITHGDTVLAPRRRRA